MHFGHFHTSTIQTLWGCTIQQSLRSVWSTRPIFYVNNEFLITIIPKKFHKFESCLSIFKILQYKSRISSQETVDSAKIGKVVNLMYWQPLLFLGCSILQQRRAASLPVKKPPFPSSLLAMVHKDVCASSDLDHSTLAF